VDVDDQDDAPSPPAARLFAARPPETPLVLGPQDDDDRSTAVLGTTRLLMLR
jgi:hypothetical protein